MEGIYDAIFQLIAEERKKNGMPAIMQGKLISRLVNLIDAMLEYEGPKHDSTTGK